MSSSLRWVITCPLHIEKLLDQELRSLLQGLKLSAGKVSLESPLEAGFRICYGLDWQIECCSSLVNGMEKMEILSIRMLVNFLTNIFDLIKLLQSVFTGPINIFVIPIMDLKY